MSRQPPNDNNNNNQFDAEFEAIEKAMNTMMQGAFSMMFKQFTESNIFGNLESAFPGGFTTTTVFDGRNLEEERGMVEDDSYGGNDFKKLAKKSKENRGQSTTTDEIAKHANTSLIFNLLFQPPPAAMFKQEETKEPTSAITSNNNNNDQSGWSYTSTSSRTVYNPDGTQETITTKKSNGVTETIRQIRYPDGHTEQIREEKNSLWKRIFG